MIQTERNKRFVTDGEEFDLTQNYHAPFLSPRIQERLTQIGGTNRYGEPNFRVVWGQDQTKIAMGAFHMKYIIGRAVEKRPIYDEERKVWKVRATVTEIGLPRFVIENWLPPEYWDRDEWESRRNQFIDGELVDVLGPFPERGDYRHYMTIETEDGKFKYPDDTDLDFIQEGLWLAQHRPVSPEQETRDMIYSAEKAREKQSDQFEAEIIDEMKIHAHRVINPHRADRGGSGHRVFHHADSQKFLEVTKS
jgi:hypothetical protein